MIRIREESELRHVLAHLVLAIEQLAQGRPESALDDLRGIDGLIFYDRDVKRTEAMIRRARRGEKTT